MKDKKLEKLTKEHGTILSLNEAEKTRLTNKGYKVEEIQTPCGSSGNQAVSRPIKGFFGLLLILFLALPAMAQEELPPIYETTANEPSHWYRINATFDTHADTAAFKVYVRNEFEVIPFTDTDGKQKVRVINHNPYAYTPAGKDVFELPAVAEKRRLFGIFKRK